MQLHSFEVGKPLVPDKTHWPEVNDFNFDAAGYELRIFLRRPTPAEIAGVSGPWEFALAVVDGIVWLCFRCGPGGAGIPWSDASYHWHLVPEGKRALPRPDTPESRALLQVFLTDASTGILRALHAVTLSPGCTRALNAAIRSQADGPDPGRPEITRRVNATMRRYRTEDLVALAVARCRGGE